MRRLAAIEVDCHRCGALAGMPCADLEPGMFHGQRWQVLPGEPVLRPPQDTRLVRALQALIDGTAALLRSDAGEVVDALCTANHQLGAAGAGGAPADDVAEVASVATLLQLEARRLLKVRGAA